jgi:DNA polymerase (family 10)
VNRRQVAAALEEIALLLDLSGENPFKVRAYAAAARGAQSLPGDFLTAVTDGSLRKVKGIGTAIFEKIAALVTTGELPYLDELKRRFPPGLFELFRIPGLGPKKVRLLYEKLGVDSLSGLERACRDDRVRGLPGLGGRTQENILKGIALAAAHAEYRLFDEAEQAAGELREAVEQTGLAGRVAIAGSVRRLREVIRNVDVLASADQPAELADGFAATGAVDVVTARTPEAVSVRLRSGMAGRLRIVPAKRFSAALLALTGSREHNEALRAFATAKGFRLDELGLFGEGAADALPGGSEEEIYGRLGLSAIPPELRENLGEIEAAERGEIPRLVETGDLHGLFHVHTTESDGADTLEDMLEAVAAADFQYVAVTDHSKAAAYARGLDERRVVRQHAAIDAAQSRYPGLRIFKGTEADILADGSIDFGDEFLSSFEIVVASVHSRFGLSEDDQTRRLVKAVENPRVTILGHPTGRLLLAREGFAVRMDRVLDAAAASGCAVEINASPHRLDLDWRLVRRAVAKGVLLAIAPDAHSVEGLSVWRYGVGIARKGWARAADVLNAKTLPELEAWLRRRRP